MYKFILMVNHHFKPEWNDNYTVKIDYIKIICLILTLNLLNLLNTLYQKNNFKNILI